MLSIQLNNEMKDITSVSFAESNNIYMDSLIINAQLEVALPDEAIFIHLDDAPQYNAFLFSSTKWGEWEYDEYTGRRLLVMSNLQMTNMIMNLIAHGHSVIFTFDQHFFAVGTPIISVIRTSLNEQLEYLLNRYNRLSSPFYKELMVNQFGVDAYVKVADQTFIYMEDAEEYLAEHPDAIAETLYTTPKQREAMAYEVAREYFSSDTWADELRRYNKYNTLNNLIRSALLDVEQYKAELKAESNMLARINYLRDFPVVANVPNQDTTSPVSEVIDFELNFAAEQLGSKKQYTGVYISAYNKYYVSEADKLEQEVVNSYLYSIPEFRVPTEDELQVEYNMLSQEYEDLKALAHVNPAEAVKAALKWNDSGSYERYLKLDEKFNTILFGDLKHVESITKKPRADRYDG